MELAGIVISLCEKEFIMARFMRAYLVNNEELLRIGSCHESID
jgi:hypothetical protein